MGIPLVSTHRSPLEIHPLLRKTSMAISETSSYSPHRLSPSDWTERARLGPKAVSTPHTHVSQPQVASWGLTANIGIGGRNLDTILAVYPDSVGVIMAEAHKSIAEDTADRLTDSVTLVEDSLILEKNTWGSRFSSALTAILAMNSTASTGYLPYAVSPDSITASVPSKIALATSEASARVGLGFSIIDSSICVAVITGFPILLHSLIIFFCKIGISSGGYSTPRSPLATMRPSALLSISFKAETP